MDYSQLTIYELRNYARQVGVASPTKLKRNQLISQIEDLRLGLKVPEKKKTKRGRPVKNKLNFSVKEFEHKCEIIQIECDKCPMYKKFLELFEILKKEIFS